MFNRERANIPLSDIESVARTETWIADCGQFVADRNGVLRTLKFEKFRRGDNSVREDREITMLVALEYGCFELIGGLTRVVNLDITYAFDAVGGLSIH